MPVGVVSAATTIQVHHRLDDVPVLAWDSLVARCPDSTVFQTHGWIKSWVECCLPPTAQLRIFAAYRNDQLVGLAPLWLGRDPDSSSTAERLRVLGMRHSDYLTFPVEGACPEIMSDLLAAIDRGTRSNVTVVLPEVPQFSTLALCLARRAAEPSSGVLLRSRTPCPRLLIQDNDAGVRRMLHKKSIRRHERQLGRLGAVRIEHLLDAAAIGPLLESFFNQHVDRWARTPYPSLFQRDRNRRFYRELVNRLGAKGGIIFTSVHLNEHIVAQHFGLSSKGTLIWYKPTFDIALRKCSPGEVMLSSLIRYAQDSSLVSLDFTRGDEPFKARFASDIAYNSSYVWVRSRWRRPMARVRSMGRNLRQRALNAPQLT